MHRRLLLPILICCFSLSANAQPVVDIGVSDVGPVNYLTPGTHSFSIGGKCVSGTGFGNLNDLQAGWSFDGGPWQVYTATTPVFTPVGNRFRVNLPITPTITVNTPGQYILKVFIKSSTITDNNPYNDTLVRIVRVHNTLPPKNVLFEVYKFQGCMPCYRGDTAVNGQILPKPYMNVARLFISNSPGELFYNASADTVDKSLRATGHPSYAYDRFAWPHASTALVNLAWQNNTHTYIPDSGHRVRYLEPLSVSFDLVSYDSVTRNLEVKLKATAFDTVAGDYRFNLYLTEDSIYAMQSGAPGSKYWHTRILREMLGHAWGSAGSLPSTLLPGQSYTHNYQYTVPNNFKIEKLHLIGFVQHFDAQDTLNRRILNSVGGHMLTLTKTTSVASVSKSLPLNLYPNPSKEYVTFDWKQSARLNLQLYDMQGRLLREWYDEGKTIQVWLTDVPAGTYLLHVTDGDIQRREKLQKID